MAGHLCFPSLIEHTSELILCRAAEIGQPAAKRGAYLALQPREQPALAARWAHALNRAAAMANAYVEVLNRLSAELGTREARSNRVFLEERVQETRRLLRDAEDTLRAYQQKSGMMISPDQAASVSAIAVPPSSPGYHASRMAFMAGSDHSPSRGSLAFLTFLLMRPSRSISVRTEKN